MKSPPVHVFSFEQPSWLIGWSGWQDVYRSAEERIALSIWLAGQNTAEGTGGPFGAAVFEADTGRLVSIGVNQVVPQQCSILHAEIVALATASLRLGSYALGGSDDRSYDLATSCEPCAMCFGALLWSGVSRVFCSATRNDAEQVGFDEGPVFPESYTYLQERGIVFVRGVLRAQGRSVLRDYGASTGLIY